MLFTNIRFVLVATSHPGNIGSTARAIKTMGMNQLYLVNPRLFPDLKAKEMSAGADDILDNCVVTTSLERALQGCALVIATSARPRGLSLAGLLPTECAAKVASCEDSAQVAIVFGREHAGLTNEELLHCHYHVNIPSNPEYSSLNLAQAVQIIAYELRMKLLAPQAVVAMREQPLASYEEIENLYTHLITVLSAINFFKPTNIRVRERIRRLLKRVGLEQMEVGILRGVLSYLEKALPKDNLKND